MTAKDLKGKIIKDIGVGIDGVIIYFTDDTEVELITTKYPDGTVDEIIIE